MVDLFDREDSLNSVRGQTNFSRNQQQHSPPPQKKTLWKTTL